MLVVSLAAITKQRTALVQTDAGPKCYAASPLFGARFFSDRNVELLLGQLNHVRVSGTTLLLEIKGLFEPLDLLETLGQGELFEVNLGLLEVSDNKHSSIQRPSIRRQLGRC